MAGLPNPTLIQEGPSTKTPLVLIHDGGGTIFNYFLLKPLKRALWGIYSPKWDSGETWEGGIHEMAVEYLKLIRSEIPEGNILLGGWSLGGLISLEICRLLADEESPTLRVQGLVFIDSVYPHPTRDPSLKTKQYMGFAGGSQPAVREKVEKCMANSRAMIKSWQMPSWPSTQPPRAVLLRAKLPIPPGEEEAKEGITFDTDIARQRDRLGWEDYDAKFITSVLNVEGHHFSIFNESNISSADRQLALACSMLDPVF